MRALKPMPILPVVPPNDLHNLRDMKDRVFAALPAHP
jgi:hypothetical protein